MIVVLGVVIAVALLGIMVWYALTDCEPTTIDEVDRELREAAERNRRRRLK